MTEIVKIDRSRFVLLTSGNRYYGRLKMGGWPGVIAALCDLMRLTGGYDTCDSWHGVNLTAKSKQGKRINGDVPTYLLILLIVYMK